MLGSFVLMLPAITGNADARRLKGYFVGSVALILAAHLALPWLGGRVGLLALFLLLFFTPFNALEALLPSLTSRLAPARAKGGAIGAYRSLQSSGLFRCGSRRLCLRTLGPYGHCHRERSAARYVAHGGGAYAHTGDAGNADVHTVPPLDARQLEPLIARLHAAPGVREARVVAAESTAYLKVDSAGFDEHNVLHMIAGRES